jgi:hypothetical protein
MKVTGKGIKEVKKEMKKRAILFIFRTFVAKKESKERN